MEDRRSVHIQVLLGTPVAFGVGDCLGGFRSTGIAIAAGGNHEVFVARAVGTEFKALKALTSRNLADQRSAAAIAHERDHRAVHRVTVWETVSPVRTSARVATPASIMLLATESA